MNTAQTILAYVNGVKWPVVAGAAIAYFRKPLAAILDHVATSEKGSLTFWKFSVDWDTQLREVDTQLSSVAPSETVSRRAALGPSVPPNANEFEKEWGEIFHLAELYPSASVGRAFTQVEVALRKYAESRGVRSTGQVSIGQLASRSELEPEVQESIKRLAALRNKVMHANSKLTSEQAIDYANTAWRMTEILLAGAGIDTTEEP